MKTKMFGLIILILVCLPGGPDAADRQWRLAIEKDGVRVYERALADTPLMEYRAETVLEENIVSVSAVLNDIPAAADWFPYCLSARVLEEAADGRRTILNVADFPWPFQDRYAVFSSRQISDDSLQQIVIDFQADETYDTGALADVVDIDDMVKVAVMKGQWKLDRIDENRTTVTYTICADAGGNIPLWLTKTFFANTPYETLKKLRRFAKRPKYRDHCLTAPDKAADHVN